MGPEKSSKYFQTIWSFHTMHAFRLKDSRPNNLSPEESLFFPIQGHQFSRIFCLFLWWTEKPLSLSEMYFWPSSHYSTALMTEHQGQVSSFAFISEMKVLAAQGRGMNICNILIGNLKGESLWETWRTWQLEVHLLIVAWNCAFY